MARRPHPEPVRPSAYESLIDAERDALVQAGRPPGRADLVRALRSAAPELAHRDAARAVDLYIDGRGGLIPSTSPVDDARTGWIDGLLDAERARAARDDRPITLRALRRAVRQATPNLSPRARREALDDYLHRRGGRTIARPDRIGGRLPALALALAALAAGAWILSKFPPR